MKLLIVCRQGIVGGCPRVATCECDSQRAFIRSKVAEDATMEEFAKI